MLKKVFIYTLLATSFTSTSNANVTIINNGNNPVLWGNVGKVTNLISAISPNNTNNKNIWDGEYIIKDKFNPDRYCSFQVDNGKIKKSSLNNLQGHKPQYNKRPLGSNLPRKLTLFSCDISSDDQTITINPPTNPRVTGYVELNDYHINIVNKYLKPDYLSLSSTKNSLDENKTLFDIATIFAANFATSSSEKAGCGIPGNTSPYKHCDCAPSGNPCIGFNSKVYEQLTTNISEVKSVQQNGIPVLLGVLGGHENAGWSCFNSEDDAKPFAEMLVTIINKYNLDGVAIDDEYSNCGDPKNLQYAAMAIKNNNKWHGRILTKALEYSKSDQYFNNTMLGNYLDFGSEMTYTNTNDNTPARNDSRFYGYSTPKYLAPNQIQIGITEPSYQDIDYGAAGQTDFWKWFNTLKNNGGIMLYNIGSCSQGMTPYYQSGPITVTCNGNDCANSFIQFDNERGPGASWNLSKSFQIPTPNFIAAQIKADIYRYTLNEYASNDSIEKLIKQNTPYHPDYKLVLNINGHDITNPQYGIQVSSDGSQVANKIAFDLNEFPYKVNISGFNICSTT